LLARFQLDHILGYREPAKRLKAIGTVPADMDSAYNEVVQRIECSQPGDKELAMKTLSWLFRAQRPLRMEELLEALALEEYEQDVSLDVVLGNKLIPSDILECCKSLVLFDESSQLTRFIHFTVQEFIARHFNMLPPATHLARTCLTSVAFIGSEESHILRKSRFLDYAVEYCLSHTQGESEQKIEVQRAFLLAFADKDAMIKVWRTVYNSHKNEFPEGILHFMARSGLGTICTLVLNGGLNNLYFFPRLECHVNSKDWKSANASN
jgi:hypothetical protein